MITEIQNDIFAIDADAYAHGINNLGTMGAGIASQFKKKYPSMFEQYQKMCQSKELNLGDVFFYRSQKKPSVINIVTQNNLHSADLSAVEKGFEKIISNYKVWAVKKIAIPEIGCGLGNLLWKNVDDLIKQYFENSEIELVVCHKKQTSLFF